jgi:ferredoxin--NADP+ reductase
LNAGCPSGDPIKERFMQHLSAVQPVEAEAPRFPIPANVYAETVVSVRHYTDRLFSFRITRPQSLRFRSGEFVMIGLPNAEKPIFRAYSVASPNWDDELEFFSIKVPDGPLTSKLQKIVPGDTIIMRQKPTGTLVLDALTPAKRLFMISTGTGIAPFASVLRDPDTYEKFDRVVLTHTCRDSAELVYGQELVAALENDPLIGELTGGRVTLYNSTTREESPRMGRITALIGSGKFYADLGIEKLDPETDRVMICGSMHMLKDVKELAESLGFREGSLANPGSFVVERAFVG